MPEKKNKKRISLFVTEEIFTQESKFRLLNDIFNSLKKKNIFFIILPFNEKFFKRKKKINLSPEVYVKKKINFLSFFLAVKKINPDHFLIGGYGSIYCWISLLYAKVFDKKVTLWSGASEITTKNNNFFFNFLKIIFIMLVNNIVSYGSRSKSYLKNLSNKKKSIVAGINISDIETIKKYKILKNKNKIKNFLFVGRLSHIKGVDIILKVFKQIKPRNKFSLTFIGKGILEKDLKKEVNKNNNYFYLKNKKFKDLVKIYQNYDVLLVPSRLDPFSRVVSEGLAAGLFVIGSKYDDAAHELIVNGKNGLIIDPLNFKNFLNVLFNIIKSRLPSKNKIQSSINYKTSDNSKKIYQQIMNVI